MRRLYWHAWSKSPGISSGSSNPRSSRKPSRHLPNDERRISVSSDEPLIRTLSIARGAALTLLCLMNGASAADPGPRHVMSLSMCTDDLLLELLPPERIASVTYYSRDPGNSYQWPQAAKPRGKYGPVE